MKYIYFYKGIQEIIRKYSYKTKHFIMSIQTVASWYLQSGKSIASQSQGQLNLLQLLSTLYLPPSYHLEHGSLIISLSAGVRQHTEFLKNMVHLDHSSFIQQILSWVCTQVGKKKDFCLNGPYILHIFAKLLAYTLEISPHCHKMSIAALSIMSSLNSIQAEGKVETKDFSLFGPFSLWERKSFLEPPPDFPLHITGQKWVSWEWTYDLDQSLAKRSGVS